jgi:acyl-[acyl-carrier-protein]-phospholipid O-acyltransferase / long-chain-fatty-acid--[acyl-carrier-protein] ligase
MFDATARTELEESRPVVVGAERLPPELAEAFEQSFGVRPIKGYGTTECSPLVSVNIPPSRTLAKHSIDAREGTVGRPLPGISAKVTDLDTGEDLATGRPGMLWIQGPNIMKGYYGREDLTADAVQNGWYRTGDVASIDEDGFIRITGRESRFSKIGGEMVPHIQIEEVLAQLIQADEEQGPKAIVTAIPDHRKGERLIVIHTELDKTTKSPRSQTGLYGPEKSAGGRMRGTRPSKPRKCSRKRKLW